MSLGVAAMTGGLFVSGTLDPVVHDVVAYVSSGSSDANGLNAEKVADWMYTDDVPDWSQVRGVPEKVQRPSAPTDAVRPTIAPPESPHRFIFSGQPPMPTYSLAPRDDCMQPHNPVSIAHNFVVTATGGGSVSVRWWDMGDPDTQTYEVVAVPRYVNQYDYSRPRADPPKKFTEVKASKGCKQMSTTVTGLAKGSQYTFSLMGVNKSPLNGRAYSITRATSETITIK
ncbi:fibronectin type III domain-containing protein [Kineosporia succinea]|uniref:Fibronectin type-III domain-containing protein n=1 Tax=Kineosporia succinea TaxID=84632 RepID=A0ABT9P038_9ACTN|nr:fibronectin type III domain-containing protein [Kineosporia succinea]MDP9825779.1 hypothetical protein [Kineosporia succinea]